MKTPAKLFLFRLGVKSLLLLVLAFPKLVMAQGALNALTYPTYPPGGVISQNPVGYYNGGVGWSFVPSSDLLVTAISSINPVVSFWQGTNQIIASYAFTESQTNFQSIIPLLLYTGQNYSISCQYSNFTSLTLFYIYGRNAPHGFTVSDYIGQYGSYYLTSDGSFIPTTNPASENGNYLMGGPNFQFTAVPEPTSLSLSLLGLTVWLFRRRMS